MKEAEATKERMSIARWDIPLGLCFVVIFLFLFHTVVRGAPLPVAGMLSGAEIYTVLIILLVATAGILYLWYQRVASERGRDVTIFELIGVVLLSAILTIPAYFILGFFLVMLFPPRIW